MTRLALVLLSSLSLGRAGDGENPNVVIATPQSLRFGDQEEIHDDALRLLLNASMGPSASSAKSQCSRPAHALFALGDLLESSTLLTNRVAALRFYSKAAAATPV